MSAPLSVIDLVSIMADMEDKTDSFAKFRLAGLDGEQCILSIGEHNQAIVTERLKQLPLEYFQAIGDMLVRNHKEAKAASNRF